MVDCECLAAVDGLSTSDGDRQRRRGRRRRRVTGGERLAANSRERRRMSLLNAAFDALRSHVPVFAYERRPSRCDTLRLAARYIAVMTELLASLSQIPTTADNDVILWLVPSSLLSSVTRGWSLFSQGRQNGHQISHQQTIRVRVVGDGNYLSVLVPCWNCYRRTNMKDELTRLPPHLSDVRLLNPLPHFNWQSRLANSWL